ncbi:8951_t:CDS:1, partial [Scutellospora calospora]
MADNIDNNDNNLSSATPRARLTNSEGRGSDPEITVSSPPTPRRSLYISNAQSMAALKKQLQDQLTENNSLSNALQKQQSELEKQIKELDKSDSNEVPQELKNKLADLEKEARAIDANTEKVLGSKNLSD